MKNYRFVIAFVTILICSSILFGQNKIGISHESSIFFNDPFTLAIYYDKPLKTRNQRFILYTHQFRWEETNSDHIPEFEEYQHEWRMGFKYAINIIPARYRLMFFLTSGLEVANYESQSLYLPWLTNDWQRMNAKIKSINFSNGINLEYRIPIFKNTECIIGYAHYVLIAELGEEKILLDDKIYREGSRKGFRFTSENAFRVGVQYRLD
ncbi:hypothetical protein [Portibacter lacus]|uniref:Uncharacterized protein n=1 Tax=Portibacter lacus TaxID=1099794 RepID=A0AA37WGM1_9BACT|nr:hypothetical protein [Portibacter lacus]GLR18464.1 hypothetical protein GCM10007940_30800 [Portibacter lacus]